MDNITMRVDGNKLLVEIDLSKRLGLSKTQKSQNVATTNGFIQIPEHPQLKMNLNVIAPPR